MSAIIFNRLIGPVPVSVIVSEDHDSSIEITAIPIENGAEINDHAYVVGKTVSLRILDEGGALTHQALVAFQAKRAPFTLITGLRVYQNMLIRSIRANRDKEYSKILSSDVELQEVLIVDTAAMSADTGGVEVGGDRALRSNPLSSSRAGDDLTAQRVSGTIQRGDSPMRISTDATALAALDSLTRF